MDRVGRRVGQGGLGSGLLLLALLLCRELLDSRVMKKKKKKDRVGLARGKGRVGKGRGLPPPPCAAALSRTPRPRESNKIIKKKKQKR